MAKNKSGTRSFDDTMHFYGRIWTAVCLFLMLCVPLFIGLYFKAVPSLNGVLMGSFGVCLIFLPSSIVEVITYAPMMGTGVLALTPLTPILSDPALKPAFDNVVPALFGALGYKYFSQAPKIALAPFIAMVGLCLLVPQAADSVAILVPVSALISIGVARLLYKKNML